MGIVAMFLSHIIFIGSKSTSFRPVYILWKNFSCNRYVLEPAFFFSLLSLIFLFLNILQSQSFSFLLIFFFLLSFRIVLGGEIARSN